MSGSRQDDLINGNSLACCFDVGHGPWDPVGKSVYVMSIQSLRLAQSTYLACQNCTRFRSDSGWNDGLVVTSILSDVEEPLNCPGRLFEQARFHDDTCML